MDKLLLQAFAGKNKKIPVWFMRQAGRYLPAYRKIREHYSLETMFQTPDIAAEVTCLPLKVLEVDAAILFADILTLPTAMGFSVRFDKTIGPVIANPLKTAKDLARMKVLRDLPHIRQTIALVKDRLPEHIALIGFAGSPFTVLAYLVEGSGPGNFRQFLKFIYIQPKLYHQAMRLLTRHTIAYLNCQKQSGVEVFQLFDSWAGILPAEDYQKLVLPYVQQIFTQVALPSIYYLKNTRHLLTAVKKSKADFLSVCETVTLGKEPQLENCRQGIQGNLFNGLLYADDATLKRAVRKILAGSQAYDRYIFNLSHGVFPDTSVDKLKKIIDLVHSF